MSTVLADALHATLGGNSRELGEGLWGSRRPACDFSGKPELRRKYMFIEEPGLGKSVWHTGRGRPPRRTEVPEPPSPGVGSV